MDTLLLSTPDLGSLLRHNEYRRRLLTLLNPADPSVRQKIPIFVRLRRQCNQIVQNCMLL